MLIRIFIACAGRHSPINNIRKLVNNLHLNLIDAGWDKYELFFYEQADKSSPSYRDEFITKAKSCNFFISVVNADYIYYLTKPDSNCSSELIAFISNGYWNTRIKRLMLERPSDDRRGEYDKKVKSLLEEPNLEIYGCTQLKHLDVLARELNNKNISEEIENEIKEFYNKITQRSKIVFIDIVNVPNKKLDLNSDDLHTKLTKVQEPIKKGIECKEFVLSMKLLNYSGISSKAKDNKDIEYVKEYYNNKYVEIAKEIMLLHNDNEDEIQTYIKENMLQHIDKIKIVALNDNSKISTCSYDSHSQAVKFSLSDHSESEAFRELLSYINTNFY